MGDKFHFDYVGPLERAIDGEDSFLTVVDDATRYYIPTATKGKRNSIVGLDFAIDHLGRAMAA